MSADAMRANGVVKGIPNQVSQLRWWRQPSIDEWRDFEAIIEIRREAGAKRLECFLVCE
jgi:hypothetical protein